MRGRPSIYGPDTAPVEKRIQGAFPWFTFLDTQEKNGGMRQNPIAKYYQRYFYVFRMELLSLTTKESNQRKVALRDFRAVLRSTFRECF